MQMFQMKRQNKLFIKEQMNKQINHNIIIIIHHQHQVSLSQTCNPLSMLPLILVALSFINYVHNNIPLST